MATNDSPPKLKAPPGTCDTHMHIYDGRFPSAPTEPFTPPDALVPDYLKVRARLGITRTVVVQPSTYGTDNRCTLDAVEQLGGSARAVAVVDTSVTDEELKKLAAAGVRGIRFNLVQQGATTLDMLEPLSQRVDAMGWHCQVHMLGDKIAANADTFLKIRGRLVFDHRGRVPQPNGLDSDAFKAMRRLLDKGNTWVKLSGLYMDTKVGPPTYSDSVAVARAYAAAAPNRVVWGSDWPHPTEKPENKPDDALLFDLLAACVPDEATRRLVLVDNPAELYDFPKA